MTRFLFCLPTVALAACSGAPAAPADVATAFARKWDTGDCAGLSGLVTADIGVVTGGVEQACSARTALRKGAAREISEIKVTDARQDGDRATVRLETRYADGSTQAGNPIVLVLGNGGWKVDLLATGAARVRGLFSRDPAAPAGPPTPAPENKAPPGNIV